MTTIFSLRITIAAAFITAGSFTAHAQGISGFLNKAKQKVDQAITTGAGSPVQSRIGGNNGPIPESPSPSELTVDNNIEFAQTVLANHRPWVLGENVGADDYFYRYLRDEYKAPLRFTYDRAYVEFITPKQYYLWSVIENVCEKICVYYDPENQGMRYIRPRMLKIKEIHFTTTTLRAESNDRYAGSQGYVLSWNPTIGVLTAASSLPRNTISNFRGEDLIDFIKDNIK